MNEQPDHASWDTAGKLEKAQWLTETRGEQPQKWTPDKIPACLKSITAHDWGLICDAHNAALADERRSKDIWRDQAHNYSKQLAAEREKSDLWKRQAAFESEHREKYRGQVKLLMDALELIIASYPHYTEIVAIAEKAVANVKEGK
jgi:hypothetical protein